MFFLVSAPFIAGGFEDDKAPVTPFRDHCHTDKVFVSVGSTS